MSFFLKTLHSVKCFRENFIVSFVRKHVCKKLISPSFQWFTGSDEFNFFVATWGQKSLVYKSMTLRSPPKWHNPLAMVTYYFQNWFLPFEGQGLYPSGKSRGGVSGLLDSKNIKNFSDSINVQKKKLLFIITWNVWLTIRCINSFHYPIHHWAYKLKQPKLFILIINATNNSHNIKFSINLCKQWSYKKNYQYRFRLSI